jgi:phage recombination protein Bet
MTSELQKTESGGGMTLGMDRQIQVRPEQMVLVKSTIFPNSTDDELNLFVYYCQRKGVHPLDKLIHPVKRGSGADAKVTFQSGIDFMRSEAEGTGEYDGQDEPEFLWDEEKDPNHEGFPLEAKVRIYRKGMGRPIVGAVRWKEFYPGEKMGFQWRQMPCVMLAKCAEAQALRKAFPKQLDDLYTPEEMAQADGGGARSAARGDRSSSVRPSAGGNGNVQEAEYSSPGSGGMSLDEEIEVVLAEVCSGDFPKMKAMLGKASQWKKDGPQMQYEKIAEASAKWKESTLKNLKSILDCRNSGTFPEQLAYAMDILNGKVS